MNVISSRSFIRPAIFDLELEWTVGVGDWGGRENVLILVVFHKLQSTKTLLPSEVLVNSSAYHIFFFFVCLCLRSIQEHAANMFPSNVENRTIHSLAYREVGVRLEEQHS